MLLPSFESQDSEALKMNYEGWLKSEKKGSLDQLQNVKSWLTEQFRMEGLLLVVVKTEKACIQVWALGEGMMVHVQI